MTPAVRLGTLTVVGASFVAVYFATIRQLVEHWTANDTYSYGFAVPFISAYIVWLRRHDLSGMRPAPSYIGGTAILAAGLSMLVLGRVSSTNLLEQLSLPIALAGVVLQLFGRRVLQAVLFPIVYLFVMIPFWDFITDRLHLPFQMYSAAMGVGALRLFDLPVIRDGVLIHLPNATLEVADVCSGVNNLVAVLCVGIPAVYLYVSRWSFRAFILAVAVVIALLSNGLRVALICLFVSYGMAGPNGDIHGPFSLLRSMIIAGIGYCVLFWLISRFSDRSPDAPVESRQNGSSSAMGSPASAAILATAMLLVTTAYVHGHTVQPVPLQGSLSTFPDEIGLWRTRVPQTALGSWPSIKFDQALSRQYALADGSTVDVLLGYFETQEQGRELVGFGMSSLLPAGATPWAIAPGKHDGALRVLNSVDDSQNHVVYWYVINGRLVSNALAVKVWTTWNALTARKNNGAIVVVRTKLRSPGESLESSQARIQDFVGRVVESSISRFRT